MKRVIGFLSTAVFFTAVLLVALVGTAAAQTAPTLDHFYCYFAQGEPPLARFSLFTLQDQFDVGLNPPEVEHVQLLRVARFCNPVQKTADGKVTPIQHPFDHLAMYLLTPDTWSRPIIPRLVTIRNQFGTQRLRTGNPVLLAVPSGKTLGLHPPPLIPTDLDHFKCYLASGRAVERQVLLNDQFFQFSTDSVGVLQPILFCNPVKKVFGGATTNIKHPLEHLACYVTTRRDFRPDVVFFSNQFVELDSLEVSNPDMLCVPSLKLRWFVVPPPVPVR